MVNLFGIPLAGLSSWFPSAGTKEESLAFTADPPSFDFRRDKGLRRASNEVN
jgi:hypothetical protein